MHAFLPGKAGGSWQPVFYDHSRFVRPSLGMRGEECVTRVLAHERTSVYLTRDQARVERTAVRFHQVPNENRQQVSQPFTATRPRLLTRVLANQPRYVYLICVLPCEDDVCVYASAPGVIRQLPDLHDHLIDHYWRPVPWQISTRRHARASDVCHHVKMVYVCAPPRRCRVRSGSRSPTFTTTTGAPRAATWCSSCSRTCPNPSRYCVILGASAYIGHMLGLLAQREFLSVLRYTWRFGLFGAHAGAPCAATCCNSCPPIFLETLSA